MDDAKFQEAKRNRERREDLEKRRQGAVATMEFLRVRSSLDLEFAMPGQPAGWQLPIPPLVLREALALWTDAAKTKILELDQEFNGL